MANLNPEKTTILKALGQEWTFYYGMKALRQFEIDTGKNILRVFVDRGVDFTVNEIAHMVRVGLFQAHPTITLDDVDSLMDEVGMEAVLEAAKESLAKSLPVGNGKAPLAEAATVETVGETR